MWWLLPWYNKKLNDYLGQARAIVRPIFHGKISYGAAIWERVDWKEFDVVGLNLYKLAYNESKYARSLKKFQRHRKPIVIFEFGCCANPHSPDPRYDLDMAGYSIVKVYPSGSDKSYESGYWEPKQAFREIAEFYAAN